MKHHYHWEPREKAIKLGTRERIKENEKESGAQLGLIFCTFFFHILLSKDYLTANPVYTSMVHHYVPPCPPTDSSDSGIIVSVTSSLNKKYQKYNKDNT